MSTPGLTQAPAGKKPIATFRIMRVGGYGSDHATMHFIHVFDEGDLLEKLQQVVPHLTREDSLVGMDENALSMLLKFTLLKSALKRKPRRAHHEKGGRHR